MKRGTLERRRLRKLSCHHRFKEYLYHKPLALDSQWTFVLPPQFPFISTEMSDISRRTLLDHDRGVYFIICSWILFVSLTVVVSIRVFSRSLITRSIGSDDIAIIIPVVCKAMGKPHHANRRLTLEQILIAFGSVTDTLAVHNGLGRHENTLSNTQYEQALKW